MAGIGKVESAMTIDIGTVLIGIAGLITSVTGLISTLRRRAERQDGVA